MPLTGLTLLVVEDDYFILTDIQGALETAGAKTICKTTLDEGLNAVDDQIDAAVLDLNLGKQQVFPLANVLQDRRIPILFYSGSPELESIAAAYPNAKALPKPANDLILTQSLREFVKRF